MYTRPPSLEEFRACCRKEFAFLTEEFGFREVPLPQGEFVNPFGVEFQRGELRLVVEGVSWGYAVHVAVESRGRGTFGLGHLLGLRDARAMARCSGGLGQLGQLREWAEALRTLAPDLLSGDPNAFAAMRDEQNRASRRGQRELRRYMQALSGEPLKEAGWRRSADPLRLVNFLCRQGRADRRKDGRRKLRLLACGCCRQVWHLLADERSRRAVEAGERYADGEAGVTELEAARAEAEQAAGAAAESVARSAAVAAVAATRPKEQEAVQWAAQAAYGAADEPAAQAELVRDVFGNPFRPAAVERSWLKWNGGTVVTVARAVYEDHGWDGLPVLADALEEAGCTDKNILTHCRQPGRHVRGCWLVDLLLQKDRPPRRRRAAGGG
jgi:hypothetical protein